MDGVMLLEAHNPLAGSTVLAEFRVSARQQQKQGSSNGWLLESWGEGRSHSYRYIWMGVLVCIVFWSGESYMDARVFGMGGFTDRLFTPDTNELWMRFYCIGCILALSFYADRSSRRIALLQRRQDDSNALYRTVFHNAPMPMAISNKGN